MAYCLILKLKITQFYLLPFFFIRCTTPVQLFSPFLITRCHSLSLVITRCHFLALVAPLIVTPCTTRCHLLCHLLSFVVLLVVIRCHSLAFIVTCCTTRCHSMYHLSVFYKSSLSMLFLKSWLKSFYSHTEIVKLKQLVICVVRNQSNI